jgi:hypothetical protein
VHGVDPDVQWCKGIGERAHQSDDAVLGRCVAQAPALQTAETFQPGRRTRENDYPTAITGEQIRNRCPRGVIGAVEVDAGRRPPLFQLLFDRQLAKRDRGDARVGQHDVEPTELVDAGVHGPT